MALIKLNQAPNAIRIKADTIKQTQSHYTLEEIVSIDCNDSWGHFKAYGEQLEVQKDDFDFNETESTLSNKLEFESEFSIDAIRCKFSSFRGYIHKEDDVYMLYSLNGLLLMEITCKYIIDIKFDTTNAPENKIEHLKDANYIHSAELDIVF